MGLILQPDTHDCKKFFQYNEKKSRNEKFFQWESVRALLFPVLPQLLQNPIILGEVLQVSDALMKNGAKPSKKPARLAPLKPWAKESVNGKPRASAEFLKWMDQH